ncbi:MAG: caspase family protein [Oceanococcus sp.]
MRALIMFVALICCCDSYAQTRLRSLLIANQDYLFLPSLQNPAADVRLIKERLDQAGIASEIYLNLDQAALQNTIDTFFLRAAEAGDTALLYFAGHGIEIDGENFLLPIDSGSDAVGDGSIKAIKLKNLLQHDRSEPPRITILDACRTNPFRENRVGDTNGMADRGLAPVNPSGQDVVMFSTLAGQAAIDGDGNSPFAQALAAQAWAPTGSVEALQKVLVAAAEQVRLSTKNRQQPFIYGLSQKPEKNNTRSSLEEIDWIRVRSRDTVKAYKDYLRTWPLGLYANEASRCLEILAQTGACRSEE